MRITIDTDKSIFIVPDTFKSNLEKHNAILATAGVKAVTAKEYIESAIAKAFKNPILTKEEAKNYDPTFESKIAK